MLIPVETIAAAIFRDDDEPMPRHIRHVGPNVLTRADGRQFVLLTGGLRGVRERLREELKAKREAGGEGAAP